MLLAGPPEGMQVGALEHWSSTMRFWHTTGACTEHES